jgi:hypothetical protein
MNPKWTAWRVLLLFALVQTVIVNNYYGAGLVSSLVAPAQKNIRTVQDIINSDLKVGYVNDSYNRHFFQVCSTVLLSLMSKESQIPNCIHIASAKMNQNKRIPY